MEAIIIVEGAKMSVYCVSRHLSAKIVAKMFENIVHVLTVISIKQNCVTEMKTNFKCSAL